MSKVYLNEVKLKRAKGIVAAMQGEQVPASLKSDYSSESIADLKVKFGDMFKEDGIKASDTEAAVDYVYEKLGGATKTSEQVAGIKAKAKKAKAKVKALDEGKDEDVDDKSKDEDE